MWNIRSDIQGDVSTKTHFHTCARRLFSTASPSAIKERESKEVFKVVNIVFEEED
jgi:hypothetical protein